MLLGSGCSLKILWSETSIENVPSYAGIESYNRHWLCREKARVQQQKQKGEGLLISWEKKRGCKIRETAQEGSALEGAGKNSSGRPLTHSAADFTLEIWSVFLFCPHH